MKLIHLKNLKRECMLVELPDRSTNIQLLRGNEFIFDEPNGYWPYRFGFSVSMLGKFTDLKEEDFYYLVDSVEQHGSWPYVDIYFLSYKDSSYSCCTPKESFISAIEAEGWYVNGNPYGDKPKPCGCMGDCGLKPCDYAEWQEAQEKVIYLSNSYIFIKEEA